jgi:hypothetical protein
MKNRILCLLIGISFSQKIFSQQLIENKKMNYIINAKPNNILYHDTLYKGSNEYKDLFYRTGDEQLKKLYRMHQTNKVVGGVMSFVGALATGFGVAYATSGSGNKSSGWITAGSGFLTTLAGGVLTFAGQRNLLQAVQLYNEKYNKPSVGIGISSNKAGLVLNF